MADHYDEHLEEINMNALTRIEVNFDIQAEIENLYEQFKVEASLALREFGKYDWQHEKGDVKASVDDAINFVAYYEFEELTTSNMLKDIFAACDGMKNGVAKEIAIEYMSNIIAHWEVNALEKQASNPWTVA